MTNSVCRFFYFVHYFLLEGRVSSLWPILTITFSLILGEGWSNGKKCQNHYFLQCKCIIFCIANAKEIIEKYTFCWMNMKKSRIVEPKAELKWLQMTNDLKCIFRPKFSFLSSDPPSHPCRMCKKHTLLLKNIVYLT